MIEYRVLCDGCGAVIAASTASARAARGVAQLEHGANHGPRGDNCLECRKRYIAESNKAAREAMTKTHSAGPGKAYRDD